MVFNTVTWNLQEIITEARLITGRPDVSMISDQEMVNLINRYYQFVMPKELKIFWGYTYHTFFTQRHVDQYLAPPNFQTLNPGATIDGFDLEWYLDPDTFYEDYPQQENRNPVGLGDATFNNFTFQIPAFPVLARSVYVTDGTQVAQDNGSGKFFNPNAPFGPLVGDIDYETGVVTGLQFPTPPALNRNIVAVSYAYMPARPRGILFFKTHPLPNSVGPPVPLAQPPNPPVLSTAESVNMFVLRPVPGEVHKIKMQGIQVPPPMINLTDVPFRLDLGPLIALGASIQLFKRFNQMDQIDQVMPEYIRFKDVCMQDTYEEYLYQRSVPAF